MEGNSPFIDGHFLIFDNSGSLYFLAKTVAEPFGSDQTLI